MLAYLAAIGQLERSIPDSPQTASLIDDLSVLADETGVSWDSGSYGNPTEVNGEDYFEIPVNVTIQGQFFEVLGYLYGIADMDRLIRVDSIGISPTQDEAGFTILDVAIAARAFTSRNVAIPIVEGEDAAEDAGRCNRRGRRVIWWGRLGVDGCVVMHRDDTSSGLAAVVAILMVGLAVAMGWLIVSGTVFASTNPLLSGPLAEAEVLTIDSTGVDRGYAHRERRSVQPTEGSVPSAHHRTDGRRR